MTGKPAASRVLIIAVGCGVLVLAGLLCSCSVFREAVDERRRADLHKEAVEIRSQVMLALAARQDFLGQIAVAAVMANSADSADVITDRPDAEKRFARWAHSAVGDSSGIDMVLLSDSKGKITSRWLRHGNALAPWSMPSIPDDVSKGVLILPKCGPVVFARHALPKDSRKRQLWVVQLMSASARKSLWYTPEGRLSLVPWLGPLRKDPEAIQIDANAHWISAEGRLAVSWLVRDPNGEVIAFFNANRPI